MPAPTGGLAILVDEQRVNELLTQKSGAKAILRSMCNTLLFMVFLSLYTALALGEPRDTKRAFEGYIRQRFDTEAAVPLHDVNSIKSFWQYSNETFMPGIYGKDVEKYSYPGAEIAKMLHIEGANYLYGIARMRQMSIKPDDGCRVAPQFQNAFPVCYGGFNLEAIDREEFGPIDSDGLAMFSFQADPVGEAWTGQLATYPPGGYFQVITADYLNTKSAFNTMETAGFLNEKTRVIFMDFTIYNFNLGFYGVCRLVFELAPGGDWTKTFEVDVLMERHLSALGGGSTEDWINLAGEAILVLFVLRYLLEEASEFLSFENRGGIMIPIVKWDYFLDAWNIIDWMNLGFMILTLVLRILTWAKADGVTEVFINSDLKDIGVSKYADLHGVAANVRIIHNIIAFNTILTWFKAVKYITIVPYITTFTSMVSMSQQMLGSWFVVFGACITGFLLAFSTAFGAEVGILRTPWKAFIFIMASFLGNSEMSVIYDVAPVLGSALIVIYVVGIFFVIMNLFYAIMITTLSDAKSEEDAKQKKKWTQTMDRLEDLWKAIMVQFKIEMRIRSTFPGLYSRVTKARKMAQMREKARDDALLAKKRAKAPDALITLGPGSPVWGRRPKFAKATVSQDDASDGSGSEGSEDDLGRLKSVDQLYDRSAAAMAKTFGSTGSFAALKDQPEEVPETTADGIDLVIDATRHIASGIVERSRGARNVLLGEMAESMEVLNNVSTVLEVLAKRAADLEAQQKSVLKNQ
mmetsp:Transcript_818/g.1560  ORF Transcript_818/g.1560 Transcript_818/m.1560 type:complete len:749 (+) Transcript_818:109-2355(+)|eukprot:CAMPEP_0197650510 /NCGR_PEP_ID=MMETSP1338-20131121/30983_1 /TAXON_ID=43686 ORGANISM="Pelagodinium beii, Strain RCC1491" /NCGR_SAMPLE_ID=MMETSP1338 /ASSEMBLY_ACC=CAM_ASM_000754 /LENGTH=748 /DNA_ID=CAMNT_0043224929 /DNA_START=82 /DNA_END=2328 /DNA_ORIENTATION=-